VLFVYSLSINTVLGDARSNQNPALLAFGILFFRWHNVLARRIHSEYPHWLDEDVFQRARRLVIASLQVLDFLCF
jgi:NAD(P)H oxidase